MLTAQRQITLKKHGAVSTRVDISQKYVFPPRPQPPPSRIPTAKITLRLVSVLLYTYAAKPTLLVLWLPSSHFPAGTRVRGLSMLARRCVVCFSFSP